MSADIDMKFFGQTTDEESCRAVCLEKGTLNTHLFHPLSNALYKGSDANEGETLVDWIQNTCQFVELGFVSYNANDIIVNWINHQGKPMEVGRLKRGEKNTMWQLTTLGHKFQLVDSVTKKILGNYMAFQQGQMVIGNPGSGVDRSIDKTDQIEGTLRNEWHRSNRVKRTFTEVGFSKGKLPLDLFASMSTYYYNNRANQFKEEWDSKGVFVNWWEVDAQFIGMPWRLKKLWQRRLMELVEAWSGVTLEETDIYGMRRYETGARLVSHVDREQTHALSLIINIAQGQYFEKSKINSSGVLTAGGMEPWKVEIYDHAKRLHEIEMVEGDRVYYESASCLHGRNRPLKDAYYVNVFSHYRPIKDPNWFSKPNPDDSPKPIIDLGNCNKVSHPSGLWHKDTVHCEKFNGNPSLAAKMQYLSPSMEVLSGDGDLFKWWKMTGIGHNPFDLPSPEVVAAAVPSSEQKKSKSEKTKSDKAQHIDTTTTAQATSKLLGDEL